ncbi:MAG: ABC-type transport system involved in cytochrome c biogenesis ATPase subunit [Polyangiales bacterium]|jgi:ABC-type transport system involved in cytochrome c biogenesis ATPase subunit
MSSIDNIKRVRLRNFTVFRKLDFRASPGLNVLIGENGTGKSHLLKVLYASLRQGPEGPTAGATKDEIRAALRTSLMEVFRPDRLSRLVTRQRGAANAEIKVTFSARPKDRTLEYKFSTRQKVPIVLSSITPEVSTVFLPPHEVMSFFPGFVHAWEKRELEFDATHYDLCRALSGAPLKRGPRDPGVQALVEALEQQLGAKVRVVDGRFYVRSVDGDIEAHLVAEGLRKLATVMYLILNGTLSGSSVVFWDEPEANLNPRYVSVVAGMLNALAKAGVQVFLATHDYLLSEKLSLAAENDPSAGARFHSLRRGDDGVQIESANTLAELDYNPILDEFAKHYDEELAAVSKIETEDE